MAAIDYDSEIQPIFDSRCVNCHGNMGGLDLSSYENLMSGGISGQSVIPFDHFSSELWIRINSGQMPPGNNDLTQSQINLISEWIDEGALPEASSSSCDEGYTHIENLPSNFVNINNDENCFYDEDLNVIEELISLNELEYSNLLEAGIQSWNSGRIFNWVLTYSPNGNNGINQQLTVLPEDIGNLTNLGNLYVEWNEISELPESFCYLDSLTNFAISNNLLTSLPSNFGNLSNLFFLDLGYNKIESIPESIGSLQNMMYFWIFNNELSSLPESICDLPLNWDGVDFGSYPFFASGGNKLCNQDLIPDCIENSSNFEISLDQFYYSFPEYTPQECDLIGDLNGDTILNVLDIVLMVNMVLDVGYAEEADMNSDGIINVLDVVILINTILM
jgi:Leucine-rich repeat (LRR) protein